MSEHDEFGKDPASIIEEIEQQLEEILEKKKADIERDLEERISREKEEARRRMDMMQEEMSEDKQALTTYRDVISELEAEKNEIKKKIQVHLDRAVELQSEIELKAGLTLEELNSVRDLNGRLQEMARGAESKVETVRKSLEEKYGISPRIPGALDSEGVGKRIEQELAKLNRIKELLESDTPGADHPEPAGPAEPDLTGAENTIPEDDADRETEDAEAERSAPEVEKEQPEAPVAEPEGKADDAPDVYQETESAPDIVPDDARPDENAVQETEAAETGNAGIPVEAPAAESTAAYGLRGILEKFRKSEGDDTDGTVSYFENEDRTSLDVDGMLSSIRNKVEEARKLYAKLAQTESPKEQFFVKQEIIQHQEILRKTMLSTIRLCEKDPGFLPEYTASVLNMDVLRNVLEKVSMENWSNQEDFESFEKFAEGIKNTIEEKISPRDEYLRSLVSKLEMGG